MVLLCMLLSVFLFWESSGSGHNTPQIGTTYPSNDTLADDELPPFHYTVSTPEIEQKPAEWSYEAEYAVRPKGVIFSDERKGYSGMGYVTGLKPMTESAFTLPLEVHATQHYAVTLCLAAEKSVTHTIRINGEVLSPFTLAGGDGFIRVTFYGVFLEKGENTLSIDTGDGTLDVDYIELNNDSTIYDTICKPDASLCNKNAGESAKKLYTFLCEQWGRQIITGQYVPDSENRELNLIYSITGQLPAIRFGVLGTDDDLSQIDAALDWHLHHQGIVGLTWHWNAPNTNSMFAEECSFDLTRALGSTDMYQLAHLTYEEAEQQVTEGKLMPDVLLLLSDIDAIAEELIRLRNMDIPVLWRPLPEAGGGWYWWGASGADTYFDLWRLVYYRLTDLHALNNLIWVWNGQSADYIVPSYTYDIASVDVYLQHDVKFGSRYEQFLSLARITRGKKLLALSECGALPDQEMLKIDRSLWSFFGLWYGKHLMNPDGTFSDEYYSSNDLYNLYNSELTLSLNDFVSIYS